MSSDVYIFGYQSILAAGSLATSIADSDGQLVPARLKGYIRDWSAVRTFETNETKRYVHGSASHLPTFSRAGAGLTGALPHGVQLCVLAATLRLNSGEANEIA
jgi:hypothetical protein